ncbi:NHLP bacteriocin export ABC transporter permease/ATPase subunit [Duganella sp. PWIR1]
MSADREPMPSPPPAGATPTPLPQAGADATTLPLRQADADAPTLPMPESGAGAGAAAPALPRQAMPLSVPLLLSAGSIGLMLHSPRHAGGALLAVAEVAAPAVLPALPALPSLTALGVHADGATPLAFPSINAIVAPLDAPAPGIGDGAADADARAAAEPPLEAWLNGAAAVAACWPLPSAGQTVHDTITRGRYTATTSMRIASASLVLIQVRSGQLRIEGLDDATLQAGDMLAAPRELAFMVAKDVELDVLRFGDADTATRMSCLQKLWQLSLLMAWQQRCSDAASEQQRLADTTTRADDDLATGIGALAGLVTGDADWIAPKEAEAPPLLRVAQAIGAHIGIDFKKDIKTTTGKTDADIAAALAEANCVRTRQVLLGANWWQQDSGALLAFDADSGAPLALLPQRWKRGYVAVDADGRRTAIDSTSAANIKPFAHLYYRPLPAKALTEIDLLRFGLHGYGKEMLAVVALAGVIGALGLVVPLASARVMDVIIPSARSQLLFQMGVGLCFVTMTVSLFSLVRSLMVLRIQDKMDMAIQAAVWDRLLRMPASFHRKYSVANLESRVRACQKVIRILSARTVANLFAGAFSALNFLVLFWFSATLSLLALGLIVVAAGAVTWFRRKSVRIAIAAPDSPRNLNALVLQMIQGVGKLRVAGAERRAFALWAREHALGEVPNVGQDKLIVAESVFFRALDHLAALLLFAAAGSMMSSAGTRLSAGEFVGFFAAFGGVFHGVVALCETLISTVAVNGAYFKAKPILDTLPEAEQGKTAPGELTGMLEVNKVSFSYAQGPQVLKDVSLTARPGDLIAIVGASGSGKSTLLRLLLGFEKPASGSILYDDKDLADLHLRQLRRQFGVVLQDTRLLAGDIISNIAGDSGATLDEVWAAAEAASVADDIRHLPMGMYTMIGDGVSTLSAGQRQRLLIARALVRKPPVLFMDEATSLLDGPSQARVMRNLARLRVTRVVIAHRLTALTEADQIIVLQDGQVAERGNYRDLTAKDGLFRAMVRDQLMDQHGES